MPNPEAYGARVYSTADAAAGAADDASPAIAEALSAYSFVELKGFYSIRTPLVLPSGKEIIGQSRNSTGFVINANVNGLKVNRNSKISNFRIRGTSAMTNSNACLSIGEGGVDSARSAFRDLIVGGASTFLGDSANYNMLGDGIRGGLCFLNTFANIYVVNARYGIDICKLNGNRDALLNASIFSQCEFHSCKVGARLGRLKGVAFPGTTFEGCDGHGLVIGFCQGVDLSGVYFEANHGTKESALRADMLVDPYAVGEADPGGGLTINGCWFTKGTWSNYGLYIVRHRNVEIVGNGFNSGYGTAGIGIGSDSFNTGSIRNNYNPGNVENGNSGGMVET